MRRRFDSFHPDQRAVEKKHLAALIRRSTPCNSGQCNQRREAERSCTRFISEHIMGSTPISATKPLIGLKAGWGTNGPVGGRPEWMTSPGDASRPGTIHLNKLFPRCLEGEGHQPYGDVCVTVNAPVCETGYRCSTHRRHTMESVV